MNERLQQFLTLENLSPARLADILGVQRSGMSHILSGRNKPGYDFIFKLCTKFPDLNANWFITGKGKPYKDQSSEIPSITTTPISSASENFKNRAAENFKNNGSENFQNRASENFQNRASENSSNSLSGNFNNRSFENFKNDTTENFQNGSSINYNNDKQVVFQIEDSFKDDINSMRFFDSSGENDDLLFSDAKYKHEDYSRNTTDNQVDNSYNNQSYRAENPINEQNRTSIGKKRHVNRVIIFYNDGSFEELHP